MGRNSEREATLLPVFALIVVILAVRVGKHLRDVDLVCCHSHETSTQSVELLASLALEQHFFWLKTSTVKVDREMTTTNHPSHVIRYALEFQFGLSFVCIDVLRCPRAYGFCRHAKADEVFRRVERLDEMLQDRLEHVGG